MISVIWGGLPSHFQKEGQSSIQGQIVQIVGFEEEGKDFPFAILVCLTDTTALCVECGRLLMVLPGQI
ncbi:hypothetical protein CEXT_154831 [Caerostris extrusa]|uniref:Uncharacterized protein n=1 Tax=Caerostris extrusa TaxID=172846 RepID=A0AAV4X5H7_CAEEX|nr:hypothetical protein CEXT_154831 [Caerostris extrusa]